MIVSFRCKCGTNDPKDAYHYDGALGYEALVCKRCGRYSDYIGENKPDVWSKRFISNNSKRQTIPYIIQRYYFLLNERNILPNMVQHRYTEKLKRRVNRNIKRIENVIEKVFI